MPKITLQGVSEPVSKLILGCDNRNTVAEGAIVWDAWFEAGGNAFDTGFVYGGGLHEKVLGEWMKARGVAKQAVVVVKGAHSPYCTPRAIGIQLDISLERLGLEFAPIYIMHRDNPDVPVAEFIDALNAAKQAGQDRDIWRVELVAGAAGRSECLCRRQGAGAVPDPEQQPVAGGDGKAGLGRVHHLQHA